MAKEHPNPMTEQQRGEIFARKPTCRTNRANSSPKKGRENTFIDDLRKQMAERK